MEGKHFEPAAVISKQRVMPGTVYTIIVSTNDTANRLLVAEMEMLAGFEPPRHVHEHEDELFIIHEGRMSVFSGTEIFEVGPGDSVWLPRKIAHHYTIHTNSVKATFIASPGNIEQFFEAISIETEAGVQPPLEERTGETQAYIGAQMAKYGMRYV